MPYEVGLTFSFGFFLLRGETGEFLLGSLPDNGVRAVALWVERVVSTGVRVRKGLGPYAVAGLVLADVDLEPGLVGSGGTSSGVWLKRLTSSCKEVCLLRAIAPSCGFDLAPVMEGLSEPGDGVI